MAHCYSTLSTMIPTSENTTVHGQVEAGTTARQVMTPEERANLRFCGLIMSPLYGLGLGILAGVMASNTQPGVASFGIGLAVGGVSCKVIHSLFKRALRNDAIDASVNSSPRMR